MIEVDIFKEASPVDKDCFLITLMLDKDNRWFR